MGRKRANGVFRRGQGTARKNVAARPMRGGWRL